MPQKIVTFLTYDNQAEEAVNHYVSTFRTGRIVDVSRYGDGGPGAKGGVMAVVFELFGQRYIALNGGSHFSFAPGISLLVECETQEEIDELWEKLSAGGQQQPCGWLTDRFGVSWQIVPRLFGEMMTDTNGPRRERVFGAMMKMSKLDIRVLKEAYDAK